MIAMTSRRKFLGLVSTSLAGLGLSGRASGRPAAGQEAAPPSIRAHKTLGKTGLKVSDVSCGAISLFNPNVLRYAYDCGVTYFDTAEGYLRTQSESFLGQAFKGIRDKVVITTKHVLQNPRDLDRAAIVRRMDASLQRLQTDYVDVALVHNVGDLAVLKNDELRAAYDELKKAGKVRFTGFSTHNAKVTLAQALSEPFVQVALIIYNHMEGPAIEPLVRSVHEAGIGTVAMKVFAGNQQGRLKGLVDAATSYPQAAIRWVLSDPLIDTCIPTMSSYAHVEEYVAASGKPLDRAALQTIASYQREAGSLYCRVSCAECLAACPRGVAVNDVLRYAMYFEDYGMEKEAIRYYADLDVVRKPLDCRGCAGPCQAACPYGLEVRARLLRSHELLTV
jgi:aryl-alcohol dehydrogenase-like predicted oxidoreductase